MVLPDYVRFRDIWLDRRHIVAPAEDPERKQMAVGESILDVGSDGKADVIECALDAIRLAATGASLRIGHYFYPEPNGHELLIDHLFSLFGKCSAYQIGFIEPPHSRSTAHNHGFVPLSLILAEVLLVLFQAPVFRVRSAP